MVIEILSFFKTIKLYMILVIMKTIIFLSNTMTVVPGNSILNFTSCSEFEYFYKFLPIAAEPRLIKISKEEDRGPIDLNVSNSSRDLDFINNKDSLPDKSNSNSNSSTDYHLNSKYNFNIFLFDSRFPRLKACNKEAIELQESLKKFKAITECEDAKFFNLIKVKSNNKLIKTKKANTPDNIANSDTNDSNNSSSDSNRSINTPNKSNINNLDGSTEKPKEIDSNKLGEDKTKDFNTLKENETSNGAEENDTGSDKDIKNSSQDKISNTNTLKENENANDRAIKDNGLDDQTKKSQKDMTKIPEPSKTNDGELDITKIPVHDKDANKFNFFFIVNTKKNTMFFISLNKWMFPLICHPKSLSSIPEVKSIFTWNFRYLFCIKDGDKYIFDPYRVRVLNLCDFDSCDLDVLEIDIDKVEFCNYKDDKDSSEMFENLTPELLNIKYVDNRQFKNYSKPVDIEEYNKFKLSTLVKVIVFILMTSFFLVPMLFIYNLSKISSFKFYKLKLMLYGSVSLMYSISAVLYLRKAFFSV